MTGQHTFHLHLGPILMNTFSLECASLLERMHLSEWVHNSIYPRNIVMDYGDLSEDPALHTSSRKRRFRVIDFGRSTNNTASREYDVEWCRRKIWEVCCIPRSYHQLSVSRGYPQKVAKVEKVDLDIPAIYPVFDLCEFVCHLLHSPQILISS